MQNGVEDDFIMFVWVHVVKAKTKESLEVGRDQNGAVMYRFL